MAADEFVWIVKCCRNDWHCRSSIQRTTGTSNMPEAKNCIPPNVEVLMFREAKADVFHPLSLAIRGVHANDYWDVQQLIRIRALKHSLNVCFGPTFRKGSHDT